jgi:hypothetical protein
MNKKLLLEFIPLTLFVIFGIFTFFKIPYVGLITMLSGVMLAGLYLYGAFWLFAEMGAPMVSRVIAGLAFSITILATFWCLQKWPFWKLYGMVSYAALGIMLIVCLINFKSIAFRPLLYRCLLFAVVLSSIYCYRRVTG